MNPPSTHILHEALAGVKSHNTSEDPDRDAVPGGFLDPRSPSALRADLYVDGSYCRTIQLSSRHPLAREARKLARQASLQSWLRRDDTIALEAAWTHVSLHLCMPIPIPGVPS
ncbi:hypothetical protein ES705_42740 [subsurface metagenome]